LGRGRGRGRGWGEGGDAATGKHRRRYFFFIREGGGDRSVAVKPLVQREGKKKLKREESWEKQKIREGGRSVY